MGLKNHIVFKFLAIFLCALALLSTVAGTVGVIAFARIGLYSDSLKNVQDRQMATDMLALSERIAMHYTTKNQTACTPAFLESYFAAYDAEHEIREPQEGMWYYELVDYNTNKTVEISSGAQGTSDAVLYGEYQVMPRYPLIHRILQEGEGLPSDQPQDGQTVEDPLPTEVGEGQEEQEQEEQEPPVVYPEGWYPYRFSQTGGTEQTFILLDQDGPIYKVRLYLLPGAYEQKVAFLWELMAIAYENKYLPVVMLSVGLLLLAVCLTYLCTAAGKRPGAEEVRPVALNRLPLDLYLAAVVAAVWYLVWMYIRIVKLYFSRETAQIIALGIAITGILACTMAVGFLFACAAQLRVGEDYWWKHSVLYRLFGLLKRAGRALVQLWKVTQQSLKKLWRGLCELLPMSWQWILWALVMVAAVAVAVLVRSWWVIAVVAVFVVISVYYMLHAYKLLLDGARRMSKGDLETAIDADQLMGGFSEFATYLNALADVATVAAQKQMRSERMRAELITNVSHDIKTPLTSIINYVDLLKSAEDPETAAACLEVLSRQSLRMKKLIDDLIELSKASTGNMPVEIETADAVEYLNQAIGEFSDKLDTVPLTPIFEAPEAPVLMRCDSRLTWRVLSNLFSNAVKYALPGTRLYIDLVVVEDSVLISMKNISRQQLNVSSEELMERFVRGDASRNTEGSGLGLNIAKSLMELQKGQLQLMVDGDLFKATLVFPLETAD